MSKKKSTKRDDFKKEDILQAVIIADSFENRFAPITLSKPKALLPLANLPLIDYTLEFLWVSGVQAVVVYCCAHANQIINHLQASKWSSQTSPMDVVTIIGDGRRTSSVGDAMRELDARSLLVNDFVLVNSDTIANINLSDIIARHKQRRLKDKNAVMTVCVKPSSRERRTRCRRTDFTMTLRNNDHRILGYSLCNEIDQLDIPLDVLKEHKSLSVRSDLENCEVAICASYVPTIFADNFDYQTYDDFIKGVLIDEEISGNTIYAELINDYYAARASSLYMYNALSNDVMDRWLYPIVPDTNIGCGSDCQYNYGRHNTYLHKSVSLERDAILKRNVMIAKDCRVGAGSLISHCVIGQRCTIGDNVTMHGCYLMDGVVVDSDCNLVDCMLDDNVVVKRNTSISAGSILAQGVVVGPDVVLPPSIRLTKSAQRSLRRKDSESTSTNAGSTSLCSGDSSRYQINEDHGKAVPAEIIGSEGHGHYFFVENIDEINDCDEEDFANSEISDCKSFYKVVWDEKVYNNNVDLLYEPDSSDSDNGDDSLEDYVDGDTEDSFCQEEDSSLFYNEVVMTLERAQTENILIENIIVEINSLKHAYNINIQELNSLVTRALFNLPSKECSYMVAMKKELKNIYSPLFSNYISNTSSQVDCLKSLEEVSLSNPLLPVRDVLYLLYECDILEEEQIVSWYHTLNSDKTAAMSKKITALIDWFQEADEESD